MWRPLVAIAAIAALALAGVGLTFQASTAGPAEFTFVNGTDPQTLDPGLLTGEPESRIANELFEGLTRRDATTLRPVPGVAERWEVSDDGLTWTFHLRRDARWSDGQPVTAHDFVHAWRRVVDPGSGAPYAELFYGLRGARDYDGSADHAFGTRQGAVAHDDHTLVVELEAPTPYFLELTSLFFAYPVPRARVEARPRDWFLPEHIVGNGAFVLERWRVGDRIRLAPNPHYWGAESVQLRSVEALAIENPTTALNLYLSGAVDWLPSLYPVELVDVLKERPDFYSGASLIVYFYRINTTRPPLDDPRVRQAIGLAIDRRQITDEVMRLGQLPATTMVPPGMPGYASPESGLGFDPERARALLAEAGYPNGEGLRELGLLYNTRDDHKKIAEVIADQLRRHLGIRVAAYNQEWQSYLASVDAGDYDIARGGWIGDYADPNTFLELWISGSGHNRTGWSDDAYDALLAAAALGPGAADRIDALARLAPQPARLRRLAAGVDAARDADARRETARRLRLELMRQAEWLLVNRGFPTLPIYFYVSSGLVRPEVEGFYSTLEFPDGSTGPNFQDLHPLRGVRIADGPR